MKRYPSIALGENHRRHITGTLVILDKAICGIELWAQGRQYDSILYSERNMLSPKQKKVILNHIESTRTLLLEMRGKLNLEKDVQDISRAIQSICAGLWSDLVELQGRHLRGYGEPSPELLEYMETRSKTLIEYIESISRILAEGDPDGIRRPAS